ncbi:CsbD family protein [Lichenicoccus roseus]|uniref:CsbD family protein n=1 Tax=Lichenicoccus roseus TaxID=2683649 RepID=A0A5R9J452_9PROT|nr:CsbD family protein [Lichenicoccus roseus]TLU71643.1 CsbD family protein [Lichenicoccus roseus]
MDKDRIEGGARKIKGALKETFGKVTGDRVTAAEGSAEKAAGEAQAETGAFKDKVRDATK